MASVKLLLRSDKTDATGEAPLFIRVIKDRKAKFISLGVKFKPSEWDAEKQKVKKNHSNSARMNAFLSQKIADAEGQVADLERKKAPTSARKLKEAIKGKAAVNFFDYSYARCEKIKGTVSPGTYKNYTKYIRKFEIFMGTREVYFEDITVTTLKDYANYCSTKLGNANTTIRYSFTILSIMFKDAQREDLINANLYPFDKYRIKREIGKRQFLNKEQLEQFIAYDVSGRGKAEIFKDMFLFSVFGGGLRFGDILELQWKTYNPEEQRITKVIRKSHRQHSFKVGLHAIEILNKYKTEGSSPDDFIFPLISYEERFFSDPEYRQKVKERMTALCTMHMNKIGKELKLPFFLSFHLSRHTFATRALNNGMRIEHVSKLLDHTDIGITQIYAKIINEELDKAVDMYVN